MPRRPPRRAARATRTRMGPRPSDFYPLGLLQNYEIIWYSPEDDPDEHATLIERVRGEPWHSIFALHNYGTLWAWMIQRGKGMDGTGEGAVYVVQIPTGPDVMRYPEVYKDGDRDLDGDGIITEAEWEAAVAVGAPFGAAPLPFAEAMLAAVEKVSAKEGRYDSVNANTDSAGLSFGIIQWAQAPGKLGDLLHAMYQADPEAFKYVFGTDELFGVPDWQELLTVTNAGSERERMAPVNGFLLWKEPWLTRFRTAGNHPAFQRAQLAVAASGEHAEGAAAAFPHVGVPTERVLVLLLDTAVQQGKDTAKSIAKAARKLIDAEGGPRKVGSRRASEIIAATAAERHRLFASEPPTEASLRAARKPRGLWREIKSGEWHHFTANGALDLFDLILHRRLAHARSRGISDRRVASRSARYDPVVGRVR